jgi:hypothetical protein
MYEGAPETADRTEVLRYKIAKAVYDSANGTAASASTTAATITQGLKTVSASGTPEALGSGMVESVAIRPKKTRTTANTGNVWVQNANTNDLAGGWELAPTDGPIVITAPAGKKVNLAAIFIDVATNDDGVIYIAIN